MPLCISNPKSEIQNPKSTPDPSFSPQSPTLFPKISQNFPPQKNRLNKTPSSLNYVALLLTLLLPACAIAATDYTPGPDSTTQPSIPHGEILKFTFDHSKIFPGTTRDYWIYIPAQYKPDKPACLFVCQDGVSFRAPTVFDNLIAKNEMPITIGVFIQPGKLKSQNEATALDRFNRSYEYDGLGDQYARFLLEEILPEVESKSASDGRAVHFSHDPNDRAIGGSSSGAIAAFTAAWERPDSFSRVFSCIGTYVGLRGGERYPILIRKTEPKPIRIFLQDGSNDNNKYGGDWWMANQTMERSFIFAGYEVNHIWGDGMHSTQQATAIFPDAMRYLWKDWPTPVKAGTSLNEMLAAILLPGEGWKPIDQPLGRADGIASNQKGEVFFNDIKDGRAFKIDLDLKVTQVGSPKLGGQAFGPDGKRYSIFRPENKIKTDDDKIFADSFTDGFTSANDLVIAHNGNMYVTDDPVKGSDQPSKVWLIKPDGQRQVVDTGLKLADGITLSPDQSLLYVNDYRSHWVYSYQIQPDGTLADKQQYYWLHQPDTADDAGPDGMCVDTDGRLYVSTRMGIQVCDQAGRPNCILPTPNGKVSSITFGGPNFDTLFATCGDKVFTRKLKIKGAPAWAEPHKPAAPRL
ncbi:MAG TPA: SMP-30/gluconolactonase/LRE family protein [Tepidisphaeraceae bacterium]|jgi:sugar lactone lactonase YvrE|nr:SMP-30/gluconolactonase/LRE family protein [Tepidisphaeraceae bacterium]